MKLRFFVYILLFIFMINFVNSTNISSCQTISAAGTYNLTADLSSGSTCLTLNANNIVIDCQGHSINGTGSGYGIYITAGSVTVKNCRISNYDYGIYVNENDNYNLDNLTIFSNNYGIRHRYADNNLLSNSNVVNNSLYNLYYGSSVSNTIDFINFSDGNYYSDRIQNVLSYVPPAPLTSCKNLGWRGINYTLGSDLSSTGTCFNLNAPSVNLDCQGYSINGSGSGYGIYITAGSVTVKNCRISNYDYGIYVNENDNYNLDNLTIFSNNYGIRHRYADNNLLSNSSVVNNSFYDLYYASSNANIIDFINFSVGNHYSNSVQNVLSYVPPAPLTSCQNLAWRGMNYTLGSDLSSTGTCFNLNAPSVNLDCQGYNINGSGSGYGIYITAGSVTVKNCRISNYDRGIYLDQNDNYNFDNLTIFSNVYGIYHRYADNNLLSNSNVVNNSLYNLYYGSSVSNTIDFINFSDGVYYSDRIQNVLSYVPPAPLTSCQTLGWRGMNYTLGSDLSSTGTCFIINAISINLDCQGYSITGSGSGYGVSISSGHSTVNNCRISNYDRGLYLDQNDNYNFDNLTIFSNVYGIYHRYSDNNLLSNSNVVNNSLYNLYYGASGGSTILNSNLSNANTYNIYFSSGNNNLFYGNILGDSSKIYNTNWGSRPQVFNSALDAVGNYYDDINCNSYETRIKDGLNYSVCLDPSQYDVSGSGILYDNAPLASFSVLPEVSESGGGNATGGSAKFPFASNFSLYLGLILGVMFFIFN